MPELEQGHTPQSVAEDSSVIRHMVGMVLDAWLGVLLIGIVFVLIGLYKVWVAVPIYRASAVVEVESRSSGYAVGPEAFSPYGGFGQSQAISGQIQIIQSRTLLESVVEELDLAVVAKPAYFSPSAARIAAGSATGDLRAPPPLIPDAEQYAWGGEAISVGGLDIPGALLGVPLMLEAGSEGSYLLKVPGSKPVAGSVGDVLVHESSVGTVRLLLTELTARPGTLFSVVRHKAENVALSLQGAVRVSERGGGAGYAGSGILEISVTNPDPVVAARIANEVSRTYLRRNVERLSQQAERKLEFLNVQLPQMQEGLKSAEERLLDLKSDVGPYTLSEGGQEILSSLTAVEREISTLSLEREELSQTYTSEHPLMRTLERKLVQLEERRRDITARLEQLPDTEAQYLQITRDVDVSRELYLTLLNKAQELKLAKAGTVGNVRIIDSAITPRVAVLPNKRSILLRWLVLGALLAAAYAYLRNHLDTRLRSPDEVESRLGLPMLATIPYSKTERQLSGKAARKGERRSLLFSESAGDLAIESLRSLRTSLHFSLAASDSKIIAITGASAGLGKTFIATNLAALSASTGQKMLLVDCDMRRGAAHKQFGLSRSPGLSELLAGTTDPDLVIRDTGVEGLQIVTCGETPPNPAELLASSRMTEFLEGISGHYDQILLDCPPLLNLADAVLTCKHAGTTALVVRAGESTFTLVRDAAKRLTQDKIKVAGVIFNGYVPTLGGYAKSGYSRYYYYYKRY